MLWCFHSMFVICNAMISISELIESYEIICHVIMLQLRLEA
jgi:hypothetical protein